VAINAGSGLGNAAAVNISFSGLTETPTTMRISESSAALQVAAFTPFAASNSFALAPTSGSHVIYAQLADAARRAGMPADAIARVADRAAALERLVADLRPGDVVLVKASRGIALDLLVNELRIALTTTPTDR